MSAKPAKLDSVIGADDLAKKLASLYNQWYIQRQEKEAEWRELRNYIFATDTTKTSNSSLPWKNSTTLPKITQIRDNLHANYLDALFPNDNWLKWEGHSRDDVTLKKRNAIEAYMKNKLREGKFRQTVSKMLYDYIDYGNVFGDIVWENNKHIDPITGEEVPTFIGPKAVRISPFDIVFNPTVVDFKDSPKFTRYVKSIGELKKDLKDNQLGYDKNVVAKVIGIRAALSAFSMEDWNKAEGYLVDGFGTLQEYYQSEYVEILEFEGDIYDKDKDELLENRVITIIDRTHILRNIQNPSWFGRSSKEHVGWRDRPDNLYGMGPLDNLVGMQYRVDHLENLKADALDMTIHPPIKIVGDVEPFEWAPGVTVHVPEDGDVGMLAPNPAAFQVNNEIGYLLMMMEEMAGAPKEAMGIRSPGEKTAFEVQQLQNAAGRIFTHKVMKFQIEYLEPLLNTMLEVARRNMQASDLVRTMDTDLGVVDFMMITKEDITAKGKLRAVGSRHYATRAQLAQNINGIFNSPVGQIIAPHISAKKLAKLVEDFMGFEEYDFINENAAIFEQAETQRLVNQAQQNVMTEDQIPVEEMMMDAQLSPPQM